MGTTHNHDLPAASTLGETDQYPTINASTSRGAYVTGAQVREFAGSGLVNATASTLTVTAATHAGRVVTLNRAAGIAVTLPDATGSGSRYTFVVGTAVTSNTTTIKVPDANNTMRGIAYVAQDAGDTIVAFEAGATADTITFDGSTTGGLVGDRVELIDIAADLYQVNVFAAATGTEATPFSATVS